MNNRFLLILSRAAFFLGVMIGLVLALITIWNRSEAVHYYFDGAKHERFQGLRCPLMIAPSEKGMVTIVFKNPTGREVNFFYRAEISGIESTGQMPDQIAVSPHETKSIHLPVDGNNVDLGFFILVKINIFPNSLHRSQEAVCGIMVTNILELAGWQISAAALSLSFLGIAIGLGAGSHGDRTTTRLMQVLAFFLLLTLFAGVMGWWLIGMALSTITILLMVISVHRVIA